MTTKNFQQQIENLNKEIEMIKARNNRVEADKAWEISKTRTAFIAIVTFILIYIFLRMINAEKPFLNALFAVVIYWLSTETYGMLKAWWLKRKIRK